MSADASPPHEIQARSKPETFRARTLSVSITADDLEKSVEWYRDVVGFVVDKEHEREGQVHAVRLKAGAVRILLTQDDGEKGWDREKGVGFAMHFITAQDVDEIAERIRARGETLVLEPTDMPWGGRVLRVADPDGFQISITSDGLPE